jgi:hypothetical protein
MPHPLSVHPGSWDLLAALLPVPHCLGWEGAVPRAEQHLA